MATKDFDAAEGARAFLTPAARRSSSSSTPTTPGSGTRSTGRRRNAIARLALEYRDGRPAARTSSTRTRSTASGGRCGSTSRRCTRRRGLPRVEGELGGARPRPERVPQLAEVNEALRRGAGFRDAPGRRPRLGARMFLGTLGRASSSRRSTSGTTPCRSTRPSPTSSTSSSGTRRASSAPRSCGSRGSSARPRSRVDDAALKQLERVYWYTLEFGVVRGGRRVKAYGAGLLSSFGELGSFEAHAELRPFDCDEAAPIPYDPTSTRRSSSSRPPSGGWSRTSPPGSRRQ